MNCSFSKELLALHAGNDLPHSDERTVAAHLRECGQCAHFLEQLRNRQSQMAQLGREIFPMPEFASVRESVLSQIKNSPRSLGWAVWMERTVFLGFRRHTVVFASLSIAAIVSITLIAQMKQASATKPVRTAAVFDRGDLVRPDGYRDWVPVGSAIFEDGVDNPHVASSASDLIRNVYMDRSAFREFKQSGKFPEGSVFVLELSTASGNQPLSLQASVKDSRFDGGWGFFNFADANGNIKDKTPAIPDKGSCRSCHEERAKTDHVFTQFHPVLKTLT